MDIGLCEMSAMESIFSSDCITLSTEYKFDDISTITEISDSELEDILLSTSKVKSNMNKEVRDVVKHTLESNIDLLSDQEIIKDLLSKNVDDSGSAKASNSVIKCVNREVIKNENDLRKDEFFGDEKKSCVGSHLPNDQPFLNVNSTPKKRAELVNSNCKTQSKHVYFTDDIGSHFSETIDLKLPQIGNVIMEDQSIIRTLISKYHEQNQRIKDLEEELTLSEADCNKLKCEKDTLQKRLQRREQQLKESTDHLDKAKTDWQVIYRRLVMSRDACHTENIKLKNTVEISSSKNKNLAEELQDLTEKLEEYQSYKTSVENLKTEVNSATRRFEEIFEENRRINSNMKELDQSHSSLKEQFLDLQKERDSYLSKHKEMSEEIRDLNQAIFTVEEEKRVLHDRHDALLQKAISDLEAKEKATELQENSEASLRKMKDERNMLMAQIHKHYQGQLQAILKQEQEQFLQNFHTKESEIKQSFADEFEQLKFSLKTEREQSERRKNENMELRKQFGDRERLIILQLESIRKENANLKSQREAVLSAVASFSPPPTASGDCVDGKLQNGREPSTRPLYDHFSTLKTLTDISPVLKQMPLFHQYPDKDNCVQSIPVAKSVDCQKQSFPTKDLGNGYSSNRQLGQFIPSHLDVNKRNENQFQSAANFSNLACRENLCNIYSFGGPASRERRESINPSQDEVDKLQNLGPPLVTSTSLSSISDIQEFLIPPIDGNTSVENLIVGDKKKESRSSSSRSKTRHKRRGRSPKTSLEFVTSLKPKQWLSLENVDQEIQEMVNQFHQISRPSSVGDCKGGLVGSSELGVSSDSASIMSSKVDALSASLAKLVSRH